MITFKEYLQEIFGFSKKPKKTKQEPLTDEQRAHIHKHFPNSNAHLRYGDKNSEHVLTHNANATHKNISVSFRNEGGKLKASVGHYSNSSGPSDSRSSPAIHTDHEAHTDDHMNKIKALAE